MYVTVEGIAVTGVVALPYSHHQFGSVHRLADVRGKPFKYLRLEM